MRGRIAEDWGRLRNLGQLSQISACEAVLVGSASSRASCDGAARAGSGRSLAPSALRRIERAKTLDDPRPTFGTNDDLARRDDAGRG